MRDLIWEREDGQPWESVESLPTPPDAASSPPISYGEAQPWESLESLPLPLNITSSDRDPQPEDEWEDCPVSPTTPRATTHPHITDGLVPLYDMDCADLLQGILPVLSPITANYPGDLRRLPGSLAGSWRSVGTRPGHNSHPPVTPLSVLAKQVGIGSPWRGISVATRPLSPISPPPRKPTRQDLDVADMSHEVREGRLYHKDRKVVFRKTPKYLPPVMKNARSPRGRRLVQGGAYPIPFDSLEISDENLISLPNGKGIRDLYGKYPPWDGRKMPRGTNIQILMKHWEDSGFVEKNRRKKHKNSTHLEGGKGGKQWKRHDNAAWEKFLRDAAPEGRVGGRYYDVGKGKGKKAAVEACDSEEEPEIRHGKDRSKVKFAADDAQPNTDLEDYHHHDGEYEGAEWTDMDDHIGISTGRRHRRRFVDGEEVDIYESPRYAPDEPRPFNVNRIRDKALKTLGTKERKEKAKGKACDSSIDAEGEPEGDIYDFSDPENEAKSKIPDPYETFKKTTGKNHKHFHINRNGEAVERFVIDTQTLAEGEQELIGKRRRRPMIDAVNVKTGERTRKKIKGYDKLPTLIKVAVGVEMLNGRLPPRRGKEMEEVGDGTECGEERPARTKKKSGGKEKKDGCEVM